MKMTTNLLLSVFALSMFSMVSCDSEQSDEVSEIIANRSDDPYVAPNIGQGAQVSVSASDGLLYLLSFPNEGEARINQFNGTFDDEEIPFTYEEVDDDLSVVLLELNYSLNERFVFLNDDNEIVEGDFISVPDSLRTTAVTNALESEDARRQADVLNDIFREEAGVEAFFDVDDNGDLFVVEVAALEITENRRGKFVIAGTRVEVDDIFIFGGFVSSFDLVAVEDRDNRNRFFTFLDQELTSRVLDAEVTVVEADGNSSD
jgi:hypothetical protein